MSIGTSLGGFFNTPMEFQTHQFQSSDNNVIDPATTLDLNSQDQNEVNHVHTPAEVTPVSDIKTNNPLVTFTDKDIDTGIGLATAFSGGGLATKAETIKNAALLFGNKLYEDVNHGFALNKLMEEHGADIPFKQIKDGFTTSKGRFVTREEAFDIAKKQNQINEETLPALTAESKMLLSEDLK